MVFLNAAIDKDSRIGSPLIRIAFHVSMNTSYPASENKMNLERIIMFSDGVFAIAITLLVIELKLPHLNEPYTDEAIELALLQIFQSFLVFY